MNYLERMIKNTVFIFLSEELTEESVKKLTQGIMRNLVKEGHSRSVIDPMTEKISSRLLAIKGNDAKGKAMAIIEEEIEKYKKEQKMELLNIKLIIQEIANPPKKVSNQLPATPKQQREVRKTDSAQKTRITNNEKTAEADSNALHKKATLDAEALQKEIIRKTHEQIAQAFAASNTEVARQNAEIRQTILAQNLESMKKVHESMNQNHRFFTGTEGQMQTVGPVEKMISFGERKYSVKVEKTAEGITYTYGSINIEFKKLGKKEADGFIDIYDVFATEEGNRLRNYLFSQDKGRNEYILYLNSIAKEYFIVRSFEKSFKEENTDELASRIIQDCEWFKTKILKQMTLKKYNECETRITQYTSQAFEQAKQILVLAHIMNRWFVFRFTPHPNYGAYWLNVVFDYQNETYHVLNTPASLEQFLKRNRGEFIKNSSAVICEQNLPVLRDLLELTSVNQFSYTIESREDVVVKTRTREEEKFDVMANLKDVEGIKSPTAGSNRCAIYMINTKYEGEIIRWDIFEEDGTLRITNRVCKKRVLAPRFVNITFPPPEEGLGYIG